MNDALQSVEALRLRDDARMPHDDRVIVEAPVGLLYNGESFAVMMATPHALEDFALGFALSEGIVATPAEFRLVDVVRHEEGIALRAHVVPTLELDLVGPELREVAAHLDAIALA